MKGFLLKPQSFVQASACSLTDDMDKLKLAETTAVLERVYQGWKPKIKEARAQYLAAHPDFKD